MTQDGICAYDLKALSSHVCDQLNKYADALLKWNKKMNLTGARTREDLFFLFQDSFILAKILNKIFPSAAPDFTICDLGAGAGLPGIPLRIIWNKGTYIMVEAREKRALFLANMVAALKLTRSRIYNGRAENFLADKGHKLSCLLSRAFMPWQKLLSFSRPVLDAQGVILLMLNSPLPAIPEGWLSRGHFSYQVNGKPRCIFALTPNRNEN